MMINASTIATPTTRFVGKCTACVYPVNITNETAQLDRLQFKCPGCAAPLQLDRVYGTLTRDTCDASCMGAIGPICQCACGGANHGGRYHAIRGEITASALAEYRARVAKREAAATKRAATVARKRAERAEQEARERAAAFATWAQENGDVVAFLGDGSQFDPMGRYDGFLIDMAAIITGGRELTPNQAAAVRRSMAVRARIAAERAEQDRNARPCPTGTQTITGKIVKAWSEAGYGHNTTRYVMTVSCDGYAVRMTIPNALFAQVDDTLEGLRGARVRVTCEIEQGRRSESYGFGKRPRKAQIIPA